MKYLFLLLPLAACSSTPSKLTNPGSEVSIVDQLPASPALLDLGDVVVEQSWEFHGDEDDAKAQLRNYAARDGATIVLLQSQGRAPCEVDPKKRCVFLHGRKFRQADSGSRPSEAL